MEELNNLAYTGINNYFKALSTFGYKNYTDTYRLLALLFISELLDSQFSMYIDEDDYRTITNVMYCLFGSSCLIPYPEFNVNTSLVWNLNNGESRISEDGIARISESKIFRVANK